MIRITYILSILFLWLSFSSSAQSEKKRVRQGNDYFEDGNFQEAEKEYRKALMEKPGYIKGTFNLGEFQPRKKKLLRSITWETV